MATKQNTKKKAVQKKTRTILTVYFNGKPEIDMLEELKKIVSSNTYTGAVVKAVKNYKILLNEITELEIKLKQSRQQVKEANETIHFVKSGTELVQSYSKKYKLTGKFVQDEFDFDDDEG